MADLIIKLALDTDMSNPDNFVPNEQHAASEKVLVARQGAFFVRSLKLTQEGRTLINGTDYDVAAFSSKGAKAVGQEVAYAAVIRTSSSAPVIMEYHALGDKYASYVDVIVDMINELGLLDDIVYASDIIGLPEVYPPAPHRTLGVNLVGLQRVVEMLARIVDAIETGNPAKMQAIQTALDDKVSRTGSIRLNPDNNSAELESPSGLATNHDFTLPRSEAETSTVIVELVFVGDEGVVNATISYREVPEGIAEVQVNAVGLANDAVAQFAVAKVNGNRTAIRLHNSESVKSFKTVFVKTVMSTDAESTYNNVNWLTTPSSVDFALSDF